MSSTESISTTRATFFALVLCCFRSSVGVVSSLCAVIIMRIWPSAVPRMPPIQRRVRRDSVSSVESSTSTLVNPAEYEHEHEEEIELAVIVTVKPKRARRASLPFTNVTFPLPHCPKEVAKPLKRCLSTSSKIVSGPVRKTILHVHSSSSSSSKKTIVTKAASFSRKGVKFAKHLLREL